MRIGKITENALKRSVLKQINTEFKISESAAVGSDCAFSHDKKTFSAVCTLAADIDDKGYYAAVKACNSLFSQGIEADHVTASILLPPDAEEQDLKRTVKDIILGCKAQGVTYAGGHTETTEAVNRIVVTATCVGYGSLKGEKARAGQALVISKWIGLEGTAMLAMAKKEELTGKYPAPFIDNGAAFKEIIGVKAEAEAAFRAGATAIHDLSNGGVFAGLWEMASRAGCGLKADLRTIPVRQETIEICEFFELNPYMLLSGGALLMATDDGEKLVRELEEQHIPAAVVGYLEEGNDKILTNSDESRYLEMPGADEIHKILG